MDIVGFVLREKVVKKIKYDAQGNVIGEEEEKVYEEVPEAEPSPVELSVKGLEEISSRVGELKEDLKGVVEELKGLGEHNTQVVNATKGMLEKLEGVVSSVGELNSTLVNHHKELEEWMNSLNRVMGTVEKQQEVALALEEKLSKEREASIREVGGKIEDRIDELKKSYVDALNTIIEKLDSFAQSASEDRVRIAEETARSGAMVREGIMKLEEILEKMTQKQDELAQSLQRMTDSVVNSHKELVDAIQKEMEWRTELKDHWAKEEAERANDRAVALYYRGNFLGARRELEKAIAMYPELPEPYVNLGMVYTALGDNQKAKENFTKALELAPDAIEAHNGLGMIAFKEGDFVSAEEAFRRAIERDGKFVSAYLNLAEVLRSQGKMEEAIQCWEKVLEMDHNNELASQMLNRYKGGMIDG